MKIRKKNRKTLRIFFTIMIIMSFFINCFNIKNVKKECVREVLCIQKLENSNILLDSNNNLDFSSNALLVEANDIDVIEANENVVSTKQITDEVFLVNFENSFDTENAYYEFKENSEINNVLKNYKAHISGVRNGFEAWGVASIGMDKYTNKLLKLGNTTEVKIAVLDTGINPNHEVFTDTNIADRIDFTYSHDYVNNDNDVTDDNGHGTLVAGAIAESTPANVKIVPVKVMGSDGKGDFEAIFDAISDLSKHVDIINLSLGTDSSEITSDDFVTLENMIGSIVDESDVIIVCAAGNSGKAVEYPAASQHTLAASAIDEENSFASFSCFGNTIDFALPGVQVVLPAHSSNSDYVIADGTSISAPFLSAAVSLVKAENPSYSEEQIVEVLKQNVNDLGEEGKDIYFGYGSIDFSINMFSTGTRVEVINKTNKNAIVLFDESNYSVSDFSTNIEEGTVAVVCETPCFVYYSSDNGNTYNLLEAIKVNGYTNLYAFNFELVENTKLIVAIKGDINFSGIVNNRDITALMNVYSTGEAELSELEKKLFDINNSGAINNRDITYLMNVFGGYDSFNW